MTAWLRLTTLVLGTLLACTTAQGQIAQGDGRLSLETNLLAWKTSTVTGHMGSSDDLAIPYTLESESKVTRTDSHFDLGPGSGDVEPVGLSLAYASLQHVMPTLYVGFKHSRRQSRVEVDDAESTSPYLGPVRSNSVHLRPGVEVLLSPESWFVPYGHFDLSVIRATQASAYGPVVGAGFHAFVVPQVSLDMDLSFRMLLSGDGGSEFVGDDTAVWTIDSKRAYAVLLKLGASWWPEGKSVSPSSQPVAPKQ